MVFQKRSNFGFNGFQIPAMPRGFRSARGRRFVRRTAEDNQMYAFELLATVAGKLSQEDDTIKSPPLKDVVQLDEVKKKRFEKEPCDQGSCDEGTLTWKYSKPHAKEFSQESTPIVLEKMSPRQESKVENSLEFYRTKAESGFGAQFQVKKKGGNWSCKTTGAYFLEEDHVDLYAKPSLLASSGSSVEVPLCRKHVFHTSVPKFGNDMELLHHDEEKSSGSTQPSTITSKSFRSQSIVGRRIKKNSASKFWKVGPTLLMDGDFYSNDSGKKSMFRSRKICCMRQRTRRSSFKRKKLINRSPLSSGVGINGETFVSFTSHGEKSFSGGNLSRENDSWPSLTGQKLSKSEDYRVKFRVKSLKVPELFVEMPETATVGSLKRTVLETVTAMLENGLGVGVFFQGKKVRDDRKTLQQVGICHGDELGSLGFKLEHKTQNATKQQLSCHGKSRLSSGPESPQPLARILPFPSQDSELETINFPDGSRGEVLNTPVDHPSQTDDSNAHFLPTPTIFNPSSPDEPILTSKELVAVPIPSADNEMLAVALSSKRRELVQRRIRRPFSVAEVEALVKAVEDLGTGRWRDVKIRAFEDAKHRTYVDLKDKWKTLVHTAKISPHQRRGEPVPQELLDRVLSAHAYWSHQQAKAQAKPLQLIQFVKEGYTTDSFTDIVNPIEQQKGE